MNLQLCFINNSESEEDEKEGEINKKENFSTWVTTCNILTLEYAVWIKLANTGLSLWCTVTSFSSSCVSLLLKRGAIQVHKNPKPAAKPEKSRSGGLRNTLRNLRERLRTDHKMVRLTLKGEADCIVVIKPFLCLLLPHVNNLFHSCLISALFLDCSS